MKRIKHVSIRKKRHSAKAELRKEVDKTLNEGYETEATYLSVPKPKPE